MAAQMCKCLTCLLCSGAFVAERLDDEWMKHTLGWCTDDGKVTIDYRPVHYHTLDASEQVGAKPLLKKLSRLDLRKRLQVTDFRVCVLCGAGLVPAGEAHLLIAPPPLGGRLARGDLSCQCESDRNTNAAGFIYGATVRFAA